MADYNLNLKLREQFGGNAGAENGFVLGITTNPYIITNAQKRVVFNKFIRYTNIDPSIATQIQYLFVNQEAEDYEMPTNYQANYPLQGAVQDFSNWDEMSKLYQTYKNEACTLVFTSQACQITAFAKIQQFTAVSANTNWFAQIASQIQSQIIKKTENLIIRSLIWQGVPYLPNGTDGGFVQDNNGILSANPWPVTSFYDYVNRLWLDCTNKYIMAQNFILFIKPWVQVGLKNDGHTVSTLAPAETQALGMRNGEIIHEDAFALFGFKWIQSARMNEIRLYTGYDSNNKGATWLPCPDVIAVDWSKLMGYRRVLQPLTPTLDGPRTVDVLLYKYVAYENYWVAPITQKDIVRCIGKTFGGPGAFAANKVQFQFDNSTGINVGKDLATLINSVVDTINFTKQNISHKAYKAGQFIFNTDGTTGTIIVMDADVARNAQLAIGTNCHVATDDDLNMAMKLSSGTSTVGGGKLLSPQVITMADTAPTTGNFTFVDGHNKPVTANIGDYFSVSIVNALSGKVITDYYTIETLTGTLGYSIDADGAITFTGGTCAIGLNTAGQIGGSYGRSQVNTNTPVYPVKWDEFGDTRGTSNAVRWTYLQHTDNNTLLNVIVQTQTA